MIYLFGVVISCVLIRVKLEGQGRALVI